MCLYCLLLNESRLQSGTQWGQQERALPHCFNGKRNALNMYFTQLVF
ncbi:hypothetical protein GMES_3418 [Paraglaciecola mesophila KMM 241]|uniref:Uncharacterized protein n=1 Tax=Paraglaciecola mesophila KMM 241 TaxID=1128912 RepID=K6ZQT5_9ALTE|nr:hypothetical protein GMES_3418 [Paraglaciecola mesophila KMM 241]